LAGKKIQYVLQPTVKQYPPERVIRAGIKGFLIFHFWKENTLLTAKQQIKEFFIFILERRCN